MESTRAPPGRDSKQKLRKQPHAQYGWGRTPFENARCSRSSRSHGGLRTPSGVSRHGPAQAIAETIIGADAGQRPVWIAIVEREIRKFLQLEAAGGIGAADDAPRGLASEIGHHRHP